MYLGIYSIKRDSPVDIKAKNIQITNKQTIDLAVEYLQKRRNLIIQIIEKSFWIRIF
jgi:hypothetical protein